MSDRQAVLDAIKGLDPEGSGFWDHASNVFDLMEVAEEEIAEAQSRHPDAAEKLWDTFKLLYPGILTEYPARFYRAHCQEILERVYLDEDTRPGTMAEVLIGLSEWSLEHVPDTRTAALMGTLFGKLVPEHADWGEDIIRAQEAVGVPGSADALYEQLQRKSAIETRC
jgi:hypothetical protein